jgi:CRISPR system Cascade subunit CasE
MYLTRVELDLQKRKTLQALSAPNLLHGAIEAGFSDGRKRKLWRIDQLNGCSYLLLVSEDKPELPSLVKQFGREPFETHALTKKYDAFLNRISTGRKYRFRLTANPTTSVMKEKGVKTRGRVYANITPRYQKKWLLERAEKHGFSLKNEEFDVVSSRWLRFRKKSGGMQVTLLSVSFEGVLTVTDAEKFREVLIRGIGREKAYGMGMMTVIPLTDE